MSGDFPKKVFYIQSIRSTPHVSKPTKHMAMPQRSISPLESYLSNQGQETTMNRSLTTFQINHRSHLHEYI